ncbi:zinc finger BED domain-containing protein RICESLEEPER 4-like [Lactuca sativa]|uniref:zinc finger BED domain-containing protein RICESLEEPER 4-like n=1 Tax=Lactuca sativa TaxID=4236 RepID=UPI0022AF9053|nr:zinc finger BED domain-containing protein RICESLEEPER 4-like [Lactuca sativa]
MDAIMPMCSIEPMEIIDGSKSTENANRNLRDEPDPIIDVDDENNEPENDVDDVNDETENKGGSKKNGTSTMSYHLKNVCKRSPLYKKTNMKKQSTLNFKPAIKGEFGGSLTSHHFNQEKARKFLARMCIKDNRPFSIVDDEGFKEFVWEINPMFKFPSRWTVAKDCLSIYEEEKKKLKRLLKNQTVSLTTDTWTSVQNFNYMCLTAHWVDENWTLNKRILNFCQTPNHKGVTIGKLVYRCLQEWGIDRILTITVDNASSNDGAIKYLRSMLKGSRSVLDCKYLHLRCCAHIINLVVRDGLDEQFDTVTKIRSAVKYVRSSPSRYESFKECVEFEKIESKSKPCLDVDTRWNSTFLMLETAEKYSKAFDRLQEIDINYSSYFYSELNDDDDDDNEKSTRKRKKNDRALGAPEEEDWEKARHFMEFLKIFCNVTKKVPGNKYVTSNLFVGELVTMHEAISINKVNHRVLETLRELFTHYKKIEDKDNEKNTSGSSSSTTTSFSSVIDLDLDDGYAKYLENRGKGVNNTELDIYLADTTEKKSKGGDFDVLSWWKLNSGKYPVLSKIAKHVLGMPISTVASESAFSTGGRVIDKFRSSLTPNTAKALICTQDWLRATSPDLQETPIHGLQLEELLVNLDNLEIDYFEKGKRSSDDCAMDED